MKQPKLSSNRYYVSKTEPQQSIMRTYPALVTFDTGNKVEMQITVRNTVYWIGQLEDAFMRSWNSNPHGGHKITHVKIFRNYTEGGFLADTSRDRVFQMN